MKTLILKLEGPMASFGDVAVDETRPTARHPFKSMIVGLLGSALGYKRTEGGRLEKLQSKILIASRLDRPGQVMTDYQTALTNASDPKKPTFIGKNVWTTRPVNMRTTNNDKNPIQIYRDYLTDVSVTVAVGSKDDELIELLADAVRKPARPLFLGRKACPPTRPLFETVVEADSLHEALATLPDTDGKGGSFSIRTEAAEKHLMSGPYQEFSIRDLKNWDNNFHSNDRPVVEGIMEINFQ